MNSFHDVISSSSASPKASNERFTTGFDDDHHVSFGSCLCEGVKYRCFGSLLSVGHCHCHMCQKHHGAAFSTFAEVKTTNVEWSDGSEALLSEYRSPQNNTIRRFCRICGSSLVFESSYNRADGTIELALGTFDHISDTHMHQPVSRFA